MLMGLLIPNDSLASRIRRFAIFLSLVLPILFMALMASVALTHPVGVFFDFAVNRDAANLLYGQNGDPYSIPAVYSFPFPTFLFYWVLGGFGVLSTPQAWIAWWVVNG